MAWAARSSAVGSVPKKSSDARDHLASLLGDELAGCDDAYDCQLGCTAALALADRILEIRPALRSSCSARVLPVPVPPTMTPRCQRRGSRDNHRSSSDIPTAGAPQLLVFVFARNKVYLECSSALQPPASSFGKVGQRFQQNLRAAVSAACDRGCCCATSGLCCQFLACLLPRQQEG
eukprot:scaffold50683_cov52-Phaeocystis_antarctica.AAC.7